MVSAYRGSTPPPDVKLPRFILPTFDGRQIGSKDLRGKVVVVTFVDSGCTEACPVIVSVLGRALAQLKVSGQPAVAPLAISVEPRVDTVAHVRAFLAQRGALGRIEYLVAPIRRMRPVWRLFHVLPAVDSGSMDVHSADVRIFDRGGTWRSTLRVGADMTVANVVHDVREAAKESP